MKNYLSYIILFCLQKLNAERTTYSIYHLLKGKKSSQTIQDAHLFHISGLFQTFPQLSRPYFDKVIIDLYNRQYIQQTEGEKYKLTNLGKKTLDEKLKEMPVPLYLNGWKYHTIHDDFWRRLSLLVQVCSNLINYETAYVPIHNEVKSSEWLKITLRKLNKHREELASELLKEITSCLSGEKANKVKPEVIVLRLTGYKQIGLTPIQTAETLQLDSAYFQLEFLNSIHFMIDTIMLDASQYPILQNVLIDFQKPIILTNSSSITYRYIKSGYTIDEIAAVRNLKSSTIEDHIVEITLNDKDFSLEPFVQTLIQRKIREAINELSSKQLKTIRMKLNGEVTYFQIRLVLAKYGDQIES